jgi:hypothetical protein
MSLDALEFHMLPQNEGNTTVFKVDGTQPHYLSIFHGCLNEYFPVQ